MAAQQNTINNNAAANSLLIGLAVVKQTNTKMVSSIELGVHMLSWIINMFPNLKIALILSQGDC
jgi:hypothetical protein